MSITAAIITNHTITSLTEPVDSLLDAMFTAQDNLGHQITWTDLGADAARGTYRGANGASTNVTVIDTNATDALTTAVAEWINGH
ncbi:hypothetical protein [Mycolicibacterium sp. CBMA 226]|uniref:DUF7280 family protein n=1 Tax=Mycolicibacterium sp. CBMA 226 TaxID=2606611 RepID=UPI0012DDBDA7|nr:hypothetical protein [Mycolicibacterium sp. CBMA 226]MUL78821.1 hypothetical protein [Mycolicibacterium sp. CBMA 226]QGW61117.1 hypothetical protein ICEMyc226_00085 [Mycolicibacterium sp.]